MMMTKYILNHTVKDSKLTYMQTHMYVCKSYWTQRKATAKKKNGQKIMQALQKTKTKNKKKDA